MQLFPNPDDNFSRRLLLTGSSNISSDPPIIPVLFFFFFFPSTDAEVITVHITWGVTRQQHTSSSSYPTPPRLRFRPDPDELVVGPSKKAGRAHDSRSSGNPLLLVTPGNRSINTHTQVYSNVPGCPSAPLLVAGFGIVGGAAGGFNIIYILLEQMCVSQSERDRLRDGGCVVKKGNFCLNSSRT